VLFWGRAFAHGGNHFPRGRVSSCGNRGKKSPRKKNAKKKDAMLWPKKDTTEKEKKSLSLERKRVRGEWARKRKPTNKGRRDARRKATEERIEFRHLTPGGTSMMIQSQEG